MLFIILFAILCGNLSIGKDCDLKGNPILPEGNIGQKAVFPWLGVLRVHLHEGLNFKVGVTEIILIRSTHAIANANDVARIPRGALKDDSIVMFVLEDNTPWNCKVKDFMNHPEFEITTFNTVSLIELESIEGPFKAVPICWPKIKLNTKNELYAIGYTDENQLLEKFVYRVQSIEKQVCDEFYQRSNLMEDMQSPTYYQCAYSINAVKNCNWDNGMALASNVSGYWLLFGLGIAGPGCAAPYRFLDLSQYMSWINTAMSLDDVADYPDPELSGRSLAAP